jgi:uncharacterized membrane protein|tara:strand:+ start:1924 stop:3477 length:1554 start_codon:yes stop_codon:yes gene_type:complete
MEKLNIEETRGIQVLVFLSILTISFIIILSIDNSIWLDEAATILESNRNLAEIISFLKKDGLGPPLYYFLLSLWMRVFGISEFAVKSLSIIFYMLSLFAVYFSGKSIYDKKTGLLCLFLYMVSPLSIVHALNVRMYSLLGLVGIMSTLFFLKLFLLKVDSRKDFLLYILVNVFGTFTHYWFMFVILSQIVCYILLFSGSLFKKFIAATVISLMPFFLLWLPILFSQMDNGSTFWLEKPNIIVALKDTILNFFGGGIQPGGNSIALIVYATFLFLIIFQFEGIRVKFQKFFVLKKYITEDRNISFLIFLFVSLLVPLIISQVKPLYFIGRYTIIALFPFVMFVGSLISRFGNKFLILFCCYTMIVGLTTKVAINEYSTIRFSDKLTTEYLVKHAGDNDILIFTSLSRAPIDYYLRLLKPSKPFIKISFPSEISSHLGWRDIDKMLSQKDILHKEATTILSRILNEHITNRNKIWLFYGSDTNISNILKNKLDLHFFISEEKDLQGSFYNKILLYKKVN